MPHLRVQALQLGVAQVRTQDPVVELLWRRARIGVWLGTVMRLMFWARSELLPTARQNCSTCTAPSCFRKFMKRKRRSCWARISFSSNFSTCGMRRSDQAFSEGRNYNGGLSPLTDGFLLPTSVNFCRNGTRGDGGSVAGSGCRNTSDTETTHLHT